MSSPALDPAAHSPADPAISATVFASAGSGKTWLLVTRLVRLLLAGARPDGILALTFTRMAAGEMQSRLLERLRSWQPLDDAGLDRELASIGLAPSAELRGRARHLYEALLFAERPVRTTTFHAFCQDLLRRFPLEAEVPPGFELADVTHELQQEAWDALCAEATREPDGALAADLALLLEACEGIDNTEKALFSLLHHRSDWWAWHEHAPDPVAHAVESLRAHLDVEDESDPLAACFSPTLREELATFAALLAKNTPGDAALGDALAMALVEDDERLFAATCNALLTGKNEPRKRKPSKAQRERLGDDGETRFLELHERLAARMLDLLDLRARQRALLVNRVWYRCGERLIALYQRIKTERRLLDFADLEWRAYRLLVSGDNALWVQYKLDRRIDHLLIDEFQDTNPTQWQLVLPLLEELAAGDPERARSVFLVGDAKQSIYGFRRANPEVQKTAAAWLDERLGGGEHRLDASRRSSPAIIDVVNRIFGEGPLHDALPDFETHDTHLKSLWGRFELLPLVTPDGQPDTTPDTRPALRDPLREPRPDPDEDLHHEEGRRIAARIRELVATGTVIGEGDRARTLDYGDVFILTRSRTHIGAIERALHEAGIPYLSADRGTLLEHLEIRDLEALLRILITPFDDLALAQVLKSPLFGAEDADLERIATTQGKGWYERLQRLAEGLPNDHRLAIAAARLARWRELAGHLPVHDLLDRIFLEGDVPARYQAGSSEENAPRVSANLGRFLELALEVDSGRYPSLVHFLWRLRTLRDAGQEAPDAPPLRGAGRRVRLLTIHASKGLEAPVVFLVDSAGVNRNNRDTHTALVDWPADAARPRLIQLVQRSAERDRTSAERLDRAQTARQREEANLLYVALTRARQVLIVSGSGREPAGWYGQIHERLTDFLPEDDAGRWVHERNAMPPAASTETVVPREIDVPPALARPMFADASGNVAPSATAGGVEVDEDALARGIAIHRLLEWLSDGVPATEAALRLMQGMETAPDPRALDEWLTEATATRESPALAELFDPARFERAWNEVPLLYSDGARRVHGSIDRLIDDGDRLLIVDYKTHRIGAGAEDAVAARYHEALALYARGVQRLWPQRRVETALVFTATRRLVNVAWRDA